MNPFSRRALFFALALRCVSCLGLTPVGLVAPASASPGLPSEVAAIFSAAQLPSAAVAVVVEKLNEPGAGERLLSQNGDQPMNPASVMKLFTTAAALDLLGPAFSWRTEFLASQRPVNGVLDGPLYLKGGGAPKMSLEEFWLLLRQLRLTGVRHIHGNLLVDRTLFALPPHDPAAFDNKPLRPYNTGADAAIINFNALSILVTPEQSRQQVVLLAETPFANLRLINHLRLVDGECGEWLEKVQIKSEGLAITFSGNYPQSCGEHQLNLSPFTSDALLEGIFRALWTELGGTLEGSVMDGVAPRASVVIAGLNSPPLASAVRDINKFSNNVMARQLFLALSADPPPATYAKSADRLRQWLTAQGINAPEFVTENGSGLSRTDRVSANTLAALLRGIWQGPTMPEMMASLPILGVDGTMKRRGNGDGPEKCNCTGFAHLKTGSLDGVRALAGYLLDRQGGRWLLVTLVNHAKATAAKQGMDQLVKWVICRDVCENTHPDE